MPIRTSRKGRNARPLTPAQQVAVRRILHDRAHRQYFDIPAASRRVLDPEHSQYYWHPQRFGVQFAPDGFRAQLHAVHPHLDATWHPLKERWLIWFRKPSVQLTSGWLLLFLWEHPITLTYVPLNELVFYNLYRRSASLFGGAMPYFDRIVSEIEHSQAAREKAHANDRFSFSRDYDEYTKIKNIGLGSKFTHHHDGDPCQGEATWRNQTATTRLPGFMQQQFRRDRERRMANLIAGQLSPHAKRGSGR